jgi:hypothetical protein
MSASVRPEPLAEGVASAGEPTTEPSIRAFGPGPERATRDESRASARPAGDIAGARKPAGRRAAEAELEAELAAIIDQLDLSELQKRCLRARWLDAIIWMDRKARLAQLLYYVVRLVTIIGGLIIPALVSLDFDSARAAELVRWATFGLSLLVAISAAIEGFFRYGERWRHYRLIVERLKIEGWQFFQLSGPYAQRGSHAPAFPEFAARVEEIIKSDVQQYITEVVREKQAPAAQSGGSADQAQKVPPPS